MERRLDGDLRSEGYLVLPRSYGEQFTKHYNISVYYLLIGQGYGKYS